MRFLKILFIVILNLHGVLPVADSKEKNINRRSTLVLPVVSYSTDTGGGGGIAGIKSYHPERIRVSTIQMFALYTQKKQVSTALKWDHFFSDNVNRISFEVNYYKYPTYFYGLGNDTENADPEKYTPESFLGSIIYEHRFTQFLRVKPRIFVSNQSLVKSEEDGIIRTTRVPWGKGRMDAGAGFSLNWDSRDNLQATKRGMLAQADIMGTFYQESGGAFNTFSVDVRKFFNPFTDVVLANMVFLQDCRGDAPYYQRSDLGGTDRLRGYEFERFRDRSMLLFQNDVRYMIWGPIGAAVFIATGRVADEIQDVFSGRYHFSYGAGLRYYFNKEDNLLIRMDFARGRDSRGFYLTFGEAF